MSIFPEGRRPCGTSDGTATLLKIWAKPLEVREWRVLSFSIYCLRFTIHGERASAQVKTAGIIVLVATLAVAGFLVLLWFVGLIGGIGGGLVHLLLVLAIMVAIFGGAGGVVLLIVSSRGVKQQQ